MGQHAQTVLLKWNMPVSVENIRLVLIYQVFYAQEPVLLPLLWNAILIPVQLGGEKLWVRVRVVQAGKTGIGAVIRHAREGTLLVAQMAYGKPFVADPEVVTYAEAESMAAGGFTKSPHNVPPGPHVHRIPTGVPRVPQIEI